MLLKTDFLAFFSAKAFENNPRKEKTEKKTLQYNQWHLKIL